ncbi:hypothetical protein HanPSC8_Chr03g0103221 [Helianthus annuus]|nr:hypothetical protein HanPSC8_Chr03g0103221 [Helianthus annuus]
MKKCIIYIKLMQIPVQFSNSSNETTNGSHLNNRRKCFSVIYPSLLGIITNY